MQQGETISENEPTYHRFHMWRSVSSGRFDKITMDIFVDSTDRSAALWHDHNMKLLCKVEADVSHIPEHQFDKTKGYDGEMYYNWHCTLESICKLESPQTAHS